MPMTETYSTDSFRLSYNYLLMFSVIFTEKKAQNKTDLSCMIRIRILNLFQLSCQTDVLAKTLGKILEQGDLIFLKTERTDLKETEKQIKRGKQKANQIKDIAVQSLAIKSKKKIRERKTKDESTAPFG